MSENAVEFGPCFLKCDAEGCDHVEPVAEIRKDDIGKPCPKCGANLLTEEDFISMKVIEAALQAISDVTPAPAADAEAVSYSINPHGKSVTITLNDKIPREVAS